MFRIALALSIAAILSGAVLAAQTEDEGAVADVATVRIPTAVLAGGARLPPGTYDVRITGERPAPLPGAPGDAEQWVELAANGKVVARDVAEVLHDNDLPSVGASSRPVRAGTRVDMLKGGEFLRISVKRDGVRYLIHLPVAP